MSADEVTFPKGLPEAFRGDWPYVSGQGDYGYVGLEWRNLAGELTTERPTVDEVIECWWDSNGDDGEIGTELRFYAIVRFADGRWGYVEAWNDYTGWGCQDGVEWRISDEGPQRLYDVGMTDAGRSHLAWKP